MRILWHSNAIFVRTGYGTQSQYALHYLKELGHEVANFGWYGLRGAKLDAGDVTIYPMARDPWGRDMAGFYAEHFEADVLITLMDIWVLHDTLGGQDWKNRLPCPWIAWFPVDGEPAPPLVVEMARQADYPVVYSQFGQEKMNEAGVECDYIPHGIDRDVFSPGDKSEARRRFGLPDHAYVVSMVAANKGYPSRKAFPENLEAFARFQRRHPEAVLYLHTDKDPNEGNGVFIDDLVAAFSIPKDTVMMVDQNRYRAGMIPDGYMTDVYRMSDVLLAASMGEGFGLPIAEAQACGCPVITTDFSSMTELTVNGIATEPLSQRMWIAGAFWQAIPCVDAIEEALEAVYGWPDDKRAWKAEAGVQFIRDNYDWSILADRYWRPFLERIEKELW